MSTPSTKSTPRDLRSPLAKARDDYFASHEGMVAVDPTCLLASKYYEASYYMKNRLERAFLAGAAAQQKISDARPPRPRHPKL